jgi:hypothetical protein
VLGPVTGLAEWQNVWVELRFDVRCIWGSARASARHPAGAVAHS